MAEEEKISKVINNEFDLGLALNIFLKNVWYLLIFLVIAFFAAFFTIRYTKPIYEAMAVVKIDDKNEMGDVMKYENIYATSITGEVSRLKSAKLFEEATRDLPLEVSYFTRGRFMDTENYRLSLFQIKHQIKNKEIYQKVISINFSGKNGAIIHYEDADSIYSKIVPLNSWVSLKDLELKVVVAPSNLDYLINQTNEFYFVINSKSDVLATNYNLLDVQVVSPDAKTIGISFRGSSAQKVADMSNSLAEQFLIYNVEKKKEGANQMISFTNEQIDKTNARINYYERMLQPYNKYKDKGSLQDRFQFNYELIEKYDNEEMEMEGELKQLKKFHDLLKEPLTHNELYVNIITATNNQYINGATQNLKTLLATKRSQQFKVKEESYEFKELDYKIQLEKNDLVLITGELVHDLTSKLKDIRERKNGYLNSRANPESDDFSFDKDYMNLSRMYDINREYYSKLLSKKAEYEMVRAGYVSDNEIMESAKVPSEPILPNQGNLYLYFIGSGVFLGLMIMVVKYLLHNTISGAKDVLKHEEITMLGMVPSYEEEMPVSQLLVNKNPKSLMSEAFRSIRSNLQFLSSDEGPKVIAITSTVSGEGKTFVAINLSGIIAFSEKKVVIIDLDLRKPKIHLGFNVQNTIGMSSLLIGKSQLDDVIQKSALDNLDFITAGPIPPNPSELILSKKMFAIIAELKTRYDVVMIDNPPVGIVTDAFPILQNADYPIYVLRAGVSKKFFLSNIATLKTTNRIKNLSVILNGVEKGSRYGGYGNYGGYGGYGYGYGSGYYEDDHPQKNYGLSRLFKKKV